MNFFTFFSSFHVAFDLGDERCETTSCFSGVSWFHECMKFAAHLLVILFSVAACAHKTDQQAKDKTKGKQDATKLVGRVQSRPAGKNFVLIESYGKWTYDEGVNLYTYGPDGRTAALVTSGEKLGQFAAADVSSGQVEIGDGVYYRPKQINVENPEVITTTSPVVEDLPSKSLEADKIEPVPAKKQSSDELPKW
jgi:hypothetical protein